jgi:hypothetical protein
MVIDDSKPQPLIRPGVFYFERTLQQPSPEWEPTGRIEIEQNPPKNTNEILNNLIKITISNIFASSTEIIY